MKNAGSRKTAPVVYRASLPGSAEPGGAATTGGSAVIPPAVLTCPLLARLVGRCGRLLELRRDPVHVARVLEERLEDPPLALARGGAERGRLSVRHVEDDA